MEHPQELGISFIIMHRYNMKIIQTFASTDRTYSANPSPLEIDPLGKSKSKSTRAERRTLENFS